MAASKKYIYIYMYICTYIHICIHMYIYICPCINTYIYIYWNRFGQLAQPLCPLYTHPTSLARTSQLCKPHATLAPFVPPAMPHVPAVLAIEPAIRTLAPKRAHAVAVCRLPQYHGTELWAMCVLQVHGFWKLYKLLFHIRIGSI